jgi:hypothetical protein
VSVSCLTLASANLLQLFLVWFIDILVEPCS